jgi:hypothetical protein
MILGSELVEASEISSQPNNPRRPDRFIHGGKSSNFGARILTFPLSGKKQQLWLLLRELSGVIRRYRQFSRDIASETGNRWAVFGGGASDSTLARTRKSTSAVRRVEWQHDSDIKCIGLYSYAGSKGRHPAYGETLTPA